MFDTVKTSSGFPKAEATTAFMVDDSVVMLVEDVVKQRRKKDASGKLKLDSFMKMRRKR
jgi:hypothetical protein